MCILTSADQARGSDGNGKEPRLEFAGAIYHVLSRGNYRKELFDEGSARLFEKTLFEVCRKCEWFLHAYVIRSNHHHLAVETPEGNLVEGMRWLQGISGSASMPCAKSADLFFSLATRVW